VKQGQTGGGPADEGAWLERVRRSGIRVDREGRFWHEGQPVRHEGLRQALFRWLDRLPPPDARYILRLDADRFAYLEVEDTPLVATSLRWQGDRAWLGLSDGSEEPLDPAGLTIDEAGTLRARVHADKGARLEARLGASAATALAERIESSPRGPLLRLAQQRLLIARRT
jgi:hypothetical protein